VARVLLSATSVCLFVCVCLFVRAAERKQLELLITKIGRDIVHGRPSACTDPKVKRSRLSLGVRSGWEWPSGVGVHVDTAAQLSNLTLAQMCLIACQDG